MKIFNFSLILALTFFHSVAFAQKHKVITGAKHLALPIALIYDGPGSCSDEEDDAGDHGYGCSRASADIAKAAHFIPKFVKPDALLEDATPAQVQALFKNAKVWIQPGGHANEPMNAMTDKLISELKSFIANGGGYVGFCAGAFMATEIIGTGRQLGLGIFPGSTAYFANADLNAHGYSFEKIQWQKKTRYIYFEGGPYIYDLENSPGVEKIATYADGSIAAARTTYQDGRVYISGPHPEAPSIWSAEDGVKDPDGPDHDLAIKMVKWAAKVKGAN